MTFSAELAVWLFVCFLALVTAALSLKLQHQILVVHEEGTARQDILDWSKHLREKRGERLVFWVLLFTIGILAMLQAPPEEPPIGTVSAVGVLIRWLLVATVALGCYETATDFLFTWQQWHRVSTRQ